MCAIGLAHLQVARRSKLVIVVYHRFDNDISDKGIQRYLIIYAISKSRDLRCIILNPCSC